jgi:hypothetical protein
MPRELSRRAVLGLTVAGLTTGCLRLSQQDDEAATTARTTTASSETSATTTSDGGTTTTDATSDTTESTTAESTDSDVEYPNGVDEDGVTTSVLLEHRAALADETVTVTQTEIDQYTSQTATRRVGTDAAFVTEEEGPMSLESYFSPDGRFVRASRDGQTIYGYSENEPFARERFLRLDLLRALIQTGDFAPTGTTTQDGTTVIIVEADSVQTNAVAERFGGTEVTSFEGSARITTDGLIRELSATFSFTRGGETESKQIEFAFTDIGATSVSKPDWTATARERAPDFEVTAPDDGQFIRVEHVGGDGVPIANVGVFQPFSGGENYFTEIRGGIAAGDVLYLYKDGSRSGLGVDVNSQPSGSPEPFSGEWRVNVFAGPVDLHDGSVTI